MLLLTNVPAGRADAARVASGYYWRRRIESPHRSLKSAGWQSEGRLQRNGQRLLRKLLVATGACVEVWALERRGDESSESFKRLLVPLSGRQTKARQEITTTALLAGLWVSQQAATWLVRDGPGDATNALLRQHLPLFANASQPNNNV